MMRSFDLEWPIEIKSGNWWGLAQSVAAHRQRAALTKKHRQFAKACIKSQSRHLPPGPWTITLTRLYGLNSKLKHERRWDMDNAIRGFKAIRDGIADALGINDGDANAATWEYGQEKVIRSGVRVRIETRKT